MRRIILGSALVVVSTLAPMAGGHKAAFADPAKESPRHKIHRLVEAGDFDRILHDRGFADTVEAYAPAVLNYVSRDALTQTFGSLNAAIKVGFEKASPTLINGQLGLELDLSTPQRTIKLLVAKNSDGSATVISRQESEATTTAGSVQ